MDQGVISLDRNEQRMYTLALDVIYQKLTIKEFSVLINKSYRQSQRIIKKIQNKGILGLKHGNLSKSPWNKTSDDLRRQVMDLFERYYFDFNLTHFAEKLKEEHGIIIRRETLRKWAHQRNHVNKAKKRRAKKVYRPRLRMPQEGLLVQFDGSEHAWFGSKKSIYTLIGGVDDATGEVLYLEFFAGEYTFNCMKTMKGIVKNKGIPQAFYLDQAGHFGKMHAEQNSTQIGRALAELGCKVILASAPQSKGRIERLWGTLQDRLIAELRYHDIKTVQKANKYLQDIFIPDYNKKFKVPARQTKSAYKPVPSWIKLNKVFTIKDKRRITSGNVFSYENEKYVINYDVNLRYKFITILNYDDGRIEFEVMGKSVTASKIEKIRDNINEQDKEAA